MHDRPSIGRRISIRGPTGSGKTTLGHTLGQGLGLPVVELDALYWLPNWQVKPLEQFRADVQATLDACPQGWICVGNYHHVQDLVLAQTDTVSVVAAAVPCLLLAALEAHRRSGVDAAAAVGRQPEPGVLASELLQPQLHSAVRYDQSHNARREHAAHPARDTPPRRGYRTAVGQGSPAVAGKIVPA